VRKYPITDRKALGAGILFAAVLADAALSLSGPEKTSLSRLVAFLALLTSVALLFHNTIVWPAGSVPPRLSAALALKLFTQYTKAFNLISVCYLTMAMYDDAIANAREALRVEPHFQRATSNLTLAGQRKAQGFVPPPSAPAAAQQQVPAAPTVDGHLSSSLQNYRAGRMQQCIDDARAAPKFQPNLPVAWNNIAAYSNDLAKPDDAVAAAAQALRLQPDFQLARNNLALTLRLKAAASQARKQR
jgi:tetratricopeptide (TPR) repeat protein